jgi:cold shock protein
MARGAVQWFNSQKGFGFIRPQGGGKDVFVHISAVEKAGLAGLNEGQVIEYEEVSNVRQDLRGKSQSPAVTSQVRSRILWCTGAAPQRIVLRRTQHPTWKHPHKIDGQILANRFDVLRRCIREKDSDPIRHFAEVLVLVEQYDNDLGVELRTDLVTHAPTPHEFAGTLSARAEDLVAKSQHPPAISKG